MSWVTWSLLSALFAGATAILAKQGVAKVDSNLATAIRTSVILVIAWSIAIATVPVGAIFSIGRRSLAFLILSGVATGLSWLCYFRALQLGEASRVAPLDKLSVVFVVVFAITFLGERPSPVGIAGAGLITLGALLLALK